MTLEAPRVRNLINEQDTRQLWRSLGLLDADDVFIQFPEWLVEEKTDDVRGSLATTFVGYISRETEDAVLSKDSSPGRRLMQIAHKIHSLENGVENTAVDSDRRNRLNNELQKNTGDSRSSPPREIRSTIVNYGRGAPVGGGRPAKAADEHRPCSPCQHDTCTRRHPAVRRAGRDGWFATSVLECTVVLFVGDGQPPRRPTLRCVSKRLELSQEFIGVVRPLSNTP